MTSTRTVYSNPWISVIEDHVVRPDGSPGIYGVIEAANDSVFVVALSDADEVVLLELDRHTTGLSIELPAGGTDGDDPLVAAQRELLEETGLTASDWRQIGSMNALNGICRAREHIFLARGLTAAAASGQAEEGIARVMLVPWSEALGMVADGSIGDGETVAALMYAALALGRVG